MAESVTIAQGQTIILDLNGMMLVNASDAQDSTIAAAQRKHTITNNGTLTITGNGTVDNVSHGVSALVNNGTAEVNGCTIARSVEKGAGTKDDGGNSYYFIENYGTMTLTDVTAESNGKYSSMVRNGTTGKVGTLTIEGNTSLVNGNTAVKNECGTLTVNGGTLTSLTSGYSVANYGTAYLNGGDYTRSGNYAVWTNASDESPNYQEHSAGTLTISGGTFEQDVTKYCVAGTQWDETTKGIVAAAGEGYVAQVGNRSYASLQAAIDAAKNGETVVMLANYNESTRINVSSGTLTLDLNGCTLAPKANYGIYLEGGSLTVVDSGTNKGKITSNFYGIFVKGDAQLVVDGAVIRAQGPILTNGSSATAKCTITIKGDAVIEGSLIGIYQPSPATLNIEGGTISGYTGIEVHAGTLNIPADSTAVITGDYTINGTHYGFGANSNDNGQGTFGAGVAAFKHKNANDLTVNIAGGTLKGYFPLYEGDMTTSSGTIALSVTGGSFECLSRTVTATA